VKDNQEIPSVILMSANDGFKTLIRWAKKQDHWLVPIVSSNSVRLARSLCDRYKSKIGEKESPQLLILKNNISSEFPEVRILAFPKSELSSEQLLYEYVSAPYEVLVRDLENSCFLTFDERSTAAAAELSHHMRNWISNNQPSDN